jgi:hypothetical protein
MTERRDIQTVDARAVFRIAARARWIAPCRGLAEPSTVV